MAYLRSQENRFHSPQWTQEGTEDQRQQAIWTRTRTARPWPARPPVPFSRTSLAPNRWHHGESIVLIGHGLSGHQDGPCDPAAVSQAEGGSGVCGVARPGVWSRKLTLHSGPHKGLDTAWHTHWTPTRTAGDLGQIRWAGPFLPASGPSVSPRVGPERSRQGVGLPFLKPLHFEGGEGSWGASWREDRCTYPAA